MKQFIILAAMLGSCSSEQSIPKPPPHEASDPTYCEPACKHLQDLGCEEGDPIYNSDIPGPVDVPNQSCAAWCKELQDRDAALNPKCLLLVPDCNSIEDWRAKDPSQCEPDGG